MTERKAPTSDTGSCREIVGQALPSHGGQLTEIEIGLTDLLCADGYPTVGIVEILFRRRKWRRLIAGLLRTLGPLSSKELNYSFQLYRSEQSFEQIKKRIEAHRSARAKAAEPATGESRNDPNPQTR
jgi:hypothetical protein